MQLTIIGAGAVGGTIGAHLIRAGHDILLCDADPTHVEAMNRDGLTIEGPLERFTVVARAVLPADLPASMERVAVAVSSEHTAEVANLLHARLTVDGYLVSFHNALGAESLASVVGRERLIASMVNFDAEVLAPGRIMERDIGALRVGELDGGITPRVRELAEALPDAEAVDNILGLLWAKEAYAAMRCVGAVSDIAIVDLLEQQRWRPLMLAVAREVLDQAPVPPARFDGFDPEDLEGSLDRLAAANRSSAMPPGGISRDLVVRKRSTERSVIHRLAGPLTTYAERIIESIERGERTCELANLELMAAYERAERLGRPLDAVVMILPSPARAPEGPLHGLPVAVKDLISVAGQPLGNGNPTAMLSIPVEADAAVVAALREAAADVFATTTLLEYAAGATHPDVPEARNPHDPSRTAGGSSGGSAALVGAGVCDVALGTDTGGSIRIPAHYCGTVGFKPGFGVLPLDGVQALAPTFDHVGLLARDLASTRRAFAALTGFKPAQGIARSMRIGLITGDLDRADLEPEVAASVRNAVAALEQAGCTVTEIDGAPFKRIAGTFEDILLYEAWQVHRADATADPSVYGPDTLRLLQAGAEVSDSAYEQARATRLELLPGAFAVYNAVDVLLSPAAPFVAPVTTPPIDTPEGESEGCYTAIHNITGAPAIALPCGWSRAGLPIGLQLASGPGRDEELLAAAAFVEVALGVERRTPASGISGARPSTRLRRR